MTEKLYDGLKEMLESNLQTIAKKGDISAEDLPKVKAALSSLDHLESYCSKSGVMHSGWNMSYGPNRSPVTGRYISGHSIKDRMVAKMESLYDEAHNEHEKQLMTYEINRLRNER